MSPQTWQKLLSKELNWEFAKRDGLIQMSGENSEKIILVLAEFFN
jgi:hypothetical protein